MYFRLDFFMEANSLNPRSDCSHVCNIIGYLRTLYKQMNRADHKSRVLHARVKRDYFCQISPRMQNMTTIFVVNLVKVTIKVLNERATIAYSLCTVIRCFAIVTFKFFASFA